MKTTSYPLCAALLAVSSLWLAGCDTAAPSPPPKPGPIARAVTLSNMKTFDVISAKDSLLPLRLQPTYDVLLSSIRDQAQAKGYQPQMMTPDFLINVGWMGVEKSVQVSQPPGPPDAKVELVTLVIVAKKADTGEVLWRSPDLPAVDAAGITLEDAKVMTKKIMSDFPPSQP